MPESGEVKGGGGGKEGTPNISFNKKCSHLLHRHTQQTYVHTSLDRSLETEKKTKKSGAAGRRECVGKLALKRASLIVFG